MKRIAILGSTGSIGCSALSVVEAHAGEVEVVALAAGENAGRLAEQVTRHRPSLVATGSDAARTALLSRLGAPPVPDVLSGPEGLVAVATHPDADIVLCATAGTTALEAVLAAIDLGRTIALANKEVLVMAGAVMVEAARRRGAVILPVDSEHNAIHQCLEGRRPGDVRRLILTASGGPFRGHDEGGLSEVTPEDALRHPTWQMGRKITVDSATLMNKGLEVIEARWLFDVSADQIDVVVHPQSVVHSLVELRDGSVIAQLGVTDMRLPIAYAFAYPDRWDGMLPSLDVVRMGRLDFEPPDVTRFPCLGLAYDALRAGGAAPVALNAANEVAVQAFLDRRIPFPGIPRLIATTLEWAAGRPEPRTLEQIREVDGHARAVSAGTIDRIPSS